MNEKKAKELARVFLSQRIELENCEVLPEGLYGFDQGKEFLFTFHIFDDSRIDGTQYVAVSKITGAVRCLS